MKKSNMTGLGPKVSEPTEKEIEETIEEVKLKYAFVIQRDDAIKFAKLTSELGWWMTVEKESCSPGVISEDIVEETQERLKKNQGEDITLDEAYRQAGKSLIYTLPIEKVRIKEELRLIIKKYK